MKNTLHNITKKVLTQKQLEALAKGRTTRQENIELMKEFKAFKDSIQSSQVQSEVHSQPSNNYSFSKLLNILSYIPFIGIIRTIVVKLTALLTILYLKLRSFKLVNIYRLITSFYFIFGLLLYFILGYDHSDYNSFLVTNYNNLPNLDNITSLLKDWWSDKLSRLFNPSRSPKLSNEEYNSLVNEISYNIFQELSLDKFKQDVINEIGHDKLSELVNSSNKSWSDTILDSYTTIKNQSWSEFITSQYFFIPAGIILAGLLYFNYDGSTGSLF